MTRDDIIKLAREAGFVVGVSEEHWGDVPYAKLCHPTPNQTGLYSMLENLIRKAAAAEREACARVCENMTLEWEDQPAIAQAELATLMDCALAIRNRSN